MAGVKWMQARVAPRVERAHRPAARQRHLRPTTRPRLGGERYRKGRPPEGEGRESALRQEVGGRTPPRRERIRCSIPLGQGVVGVCVSRSPRDGDKIVALHLVEECIDASD